MRDGCSRAPVRGGVDRNGDGPHGGEGVVQVRHSARDVRVSGDFEVAHCARLEAAVAVSVHVTARNQRMMGGWMGQQLQRESERETKRHRDNRDTHTPKSNSKLERATAMKTQSRNHTEEAEQRQKASITRHAQIPGRVVEERETKTREERGRCAARVALFRRDAAVVLEDPLVGAEVQAAVAGVVALGPRAVHEVLLRQRSQHAGLEEGLAFDGAGRAVAPAAPA